MNAAFEISHDWEEPEDLHELLQALRAQRDLNTRKIRYAYYVSEQAHKGQFRTSGEPYITHPLAVARILVDLNVDDDTICAALLHDVIEDNPDVSAEEIGEIFGPEIRHLVEGVTKLKFKGPEAMSEKERTAAQVMRAAETLRKMLLAMATDLRVMVIKLADRLHNMQTLGSLSSGKQARIATETLDVYAPLAARLGIWQFKWQLEDLAFKALHPTEFQRVSDLVSKSRNQREKELTEAILHIKEMLNKEGVRVREIQGRPKHLYSIFNKMVKQNLRFEDIYDLLALRIIVETSSECYVTMGLVHGAYNPLMALFADHIAQPKPNGYQSIHTKVVMPNGQILEIQIRTQEMHDIAEHGVAAHWSYKEGKVKGAGNEAQTFTQLRQQLFDFSSDAHLSSDFLRTVSTDLFSEQVFVFTPKGDVFDLPKDASPVDLAFRLHTKIGMTLIGAKVNGSIAPLNTMLKNGDVVELVTRANATPSLDWLEFVKSAHTRSKLRSHFRKLTKDLDTRRGRELLERELKTHGLDPKLFLGDDRLQRLATELDGCETPQDVLAKVGAGLASVQGMAQKLRGQVAELPSADRIEVTKTKEGKVALVTKGFQGISGVLVARSKCCSPIPGDHVSGYVTRGRGIMLHRIDCPNAIHSMEQEAERWFAYNWPSDGEAYGVPLKIVSLNRQGLLMDISTIFGESKTNVSAATIKTLNNQTAEIYVTIDVKDNEHLSALINRIQNFGDIISIQRMFGRTGR